MENKKTYSPYERNNHQKNSESLDKKDNLHKVNLQSVINGMKPGDWKDENFLKSHEQLLNHVKKLDLTHIEISADFLTLLGENCPELKYLKLPPKYTDDELLKHLPKGLTELNLHSCKNITDIGLAYIRDLKDLTSLDLLCCFKITDAGLANLENLTGLTSLDLSGCNGISDLGLVHLQELTELTELNLFGCKRITRRGLIYLEKLERLTSLNLFRC
ncbi:MAG: hypothetical protein K940chlam3_00070 [Chlamydiae bacterium]|nr:hypothetical protein [Chlamydiota bacterium]